MLVESEIKLKQLQMQAEQNLNFKGIFKNQIFSQIKSEVKNQNFFNDSDESRQNY